MGKKDKNKKKISGSVKTALKTEKKLTAKQKKELAAIGEDDIEKVIREIEKEAARRERIVEKIVDPPSRRVNFSLTVHPFKEELILFGGEFHDGRTTVVYGDLFFYNLTKKEWTIVKAPGGPPPRCGHQAVATSTNKGELWIFGGEFSSPSESQFYHYKDLWIFRMAEKKWEKILAPNGPSARSGHRMVHMKKQLIVFGGFHDNLRDYKYFNDVHLFHLDRYVWQKLDVLGSSPPLPRSGCILLPTPDNKLLVYGGYSKERIKKDVDKGYIHTDMFLMSPDKNDQTKWKWSCVKQTGMKPSPRCGASAILVQPNFAYIFGGVFDMENNEEELQGVFYNDLISLDLEKFQWRTVTLSGKKDPSARRKRRKAKDDDGEEEEDDDDEEEESNGEADADDKNQDDSNGDGGHNEKEEDDAKTQVAEVSSNLAQSTITDDDGIFTMTIGPTSSSTRSCGEVQVTERIFVPSPRINPGLAVKHNILYLYGGMYEDGDRLFTLNDLYSLDTRKLNEWKIITADDLSSQTWFESSSSSSEDEDEEDDESDSTDECCDQTNKSQ